MHQFQNNGILRLLLKLGICKTDSIETYHPKVRDREDIAVMRCTQSGVIFLSRDDHIDIQTYKEKQDSIYIAPAWDRRRVVLHLLADNQRRANHFQKYICNKKWLDVGAGMGGVLDMLHNVAIETHAVEPQETRKQALISNGYTVYSELEEVQDSYYQVISLFHLLEHLDAPINTLRTIRSKIVDGGKIILEVPHARDILLTQYDLEAFKDFTFWSEHLILHTRESLNAFLQEAGFDNINITGIQRYPLANHLYWLAEQKPGGHEEWGHLRSTELETAYQQMLASIDKTDTLIATASK
ncbi:MAG: class I SAM-dependent methyltransferase [Desulfurivibrionaceae bacterium]